MRDSLRSAQLNGKQFTGRFGRPRPAEVLFERICRENGITVIAARTTSRDIRRHKASNYG